MSMILAITWHGEKNPSSVSDESGLQKTILFCFAIAKYYPTGMDFVSLKSFSMISYVSMFLSLFMSEIIIPLSPVFTKATLIYLPALLAM